jgi:hypothetical protein
VTPLTQAEIVDGFHAIEKKVRECGPTNGRPDPISVRVAIAQNGKISAVTVRGQFAPTTAICLENAIKGAYFRPSPGLSADYAFFFRRIEAGGGHGPPDSGVDG